MKINLYNSSSFASILLGVIALLGVFFVVNIKISHAQTPAEENVIETAEGVGNIILDTTSEYVPDRVENKATKFYDRVEKFRLQKKEQVAQWKSLNYEKLTLERENTDGNTIVYLLKNILLSILLFILSVAFVFYGLAILIIILILRRVWAVFFGSRYG